MAVMEAKLEHKLTGIFHETLFQVFIDLAKAYDSLHIGICVEIQWVYVLGPKLQRLLQRYWDVKKVIPKAGKS